VKLDQGIFAKSGYLTKSTAAGLTSEKLKEFTFCLKKHFQTYL